MRGTSRHAAPTRRPWPAIEGERGAEAVRWQVWIGVQLRSWRKQAPFGHGRGMTQQQAARRLGLRQEALSRAESGQRRVDAYELLVFARTYQRLVTDLAALFSPPSPVEWMSIRQRFAPDPCFHEGPTGLPLTFRSAPRQAK